MPDAFQTSHLDLMDSGTVYLRCLPNAYLFDAVSLGFVGWHQWPAELGEEPDWLWPELLQCWEWYEAEWAIDEPPVSDRAVVRWMCGV